MSTLPPVKQGETFIHEFFWRKVRRDANGAPVRNPDGTEATDPVDLTGRTVTAGVRNGAFAGAVTVTVLNPSTGQYRAEVAATGTALWPETDARNRMFIDAKAVIGALVDYAPTFEIPVERGITP